MIGFPPDTVMIFSYSVRRYISNLCQKNKHVKKKFKRGFCNRISIREGFQERSARAKRGAENYYEVRIIFNARTRI